MIQLAWLIILIPLLGAVINGIGFRVLPKSVVSVVACGSVLASFAIAAGIFFETQGTAFSTVISLGSVFDVGGFSVPVAIQVDPLSVMMSLIITGVGFLIHLYSIGYMHHDDGFARYFAYLNLFVFSMLVLVLGSNYVVMFMGWEAVGFCSYLLIGFWFKENANSIAAKKAFVMNRIGDVGFLAGIFYIAISFGTVSYIEVFKGAAIFPVGSTEMLAITLLLFVGATAKSAQIPLLTWLPDAMAGPTPVSALIHAATMVTAGIYIIVRSGVLFALSPLTLEIIGFIGVATALYGAVVALTQTDIKKVLAYSTVSQLGYMFVALGVGAFSTGMFHLTTHAFFKALLFLAAGSVIHAMSGEQDIRNMGGLKKHLPVTYLAFLVGTLAIIGIPPFSGFFSKDELLAMVFSRSLILSLLLLTSYALTVIYIMRLFFLVFFGSFRGTEHQKSHLHESPMNMKLPLIVLSVLAFAGGIINLPGVLGGNHAMQTYLSPVTSPALNYMRVAHPSHTVEIVLMIFTVALTLALAFVVYRKYVTLGKTVTEESAQSSLYKFSKGKLYVDELYETVVMVPVNKISAFVSSIVEMKIIDRIVNLVGGGVVSGSRVARLAQSGNTGLYLLVMVLGLSMMLFFKFLV